MFFSRGKNKVKNPYTMPDMYEDYLSTISGNDVYTISYSVYKNIISDYMKLVSDLLLNESGKFRMPAGLGVLQIAKVKPMYLKDIQYQPGIDWSETVKHGKVIRHFNDHSNGFKYKFMWHKTFFHVKYLKSYRFVATRENKRTLAYYIKNKVRDYFECK